jgi:hypothetical protein
LLQLGQGHFCIELQQMRLEATLGQATLQRHLTAFEAHLVVAARTRLLTLVTATGGLAQTRTDTATHATLGVLGAVCRLDAIEFHQSFQRTLTR